MAHTRKTHCFCYEGGEHLKTGTNKTKTDLHTLDQWLQCYGNRKGQVPSSISINGQTYMEKDPRLCQN